MSTAIAIAYFITPHGFGHAGRSSAVMEAVSDRAPQVRFELFTTCPKRFFEQSLRSTFGYHHVEVDIGIVQSTPLREDLPATCRALDRWLPFSEAMVQDTARQLQQMSCKLAVCDISPFGIVAAAAAGIPSVLVENFTWDWIYQGYAATAACLLPHCRGLAEIFGNVDFRIQTRPFCRPATHHLTVGPISRKARRSRRQTREALDISDTDAMVLISMGGVRDQFLFLDQLPRTSDIFFVIPSADGMVSRQRNVILLPTHSAFYHPDLSHAADLVIGKVGYSTLAEVYRTGTPFGFVPRPDSPESDPLVAFITAHMNARPISAESYTSGRWIDQLPQLLALPRGTPSMKNGAEAVADFILDRVGYHCRSGFKTGS
jgi:hypothetical protein